MANLPDPIGRVFRDLGMVRGEAHTAFLRLPATDPLRPLLQQVDKILGETETNITKATQKLTSQADTTFRKAKLPGLGEIQEMSTRLPGGGRVTGIFGFRR